MRKTFIYDSSKQTVSGKWIGQIGKSCYAQEINRVLFFAQAKPCQERGHDRSGSYYAPKIYMFRKNMSISGTRNTRHMGKIYYAQEISFCQRKRCEERREDRSGSHARVHAHESRIMTGDRPCLRSRYSRHSYHGRSGDKKHMVNLRHGSARLPYVPQAAAR